MNLFQCTALASAVVCLASCSTDNEPSAPAETASVKVMHAAPFNKAKIDALLGSANLGNVEYGQRTRSYVSAPLADGVITLRSISTQVPVYRVTQPVHPDTLYSVFVYNPTVSTVAAVLTNDSKAPASGVNQALIRLANFGFDAGSVTLRAQETGASPLSPPAGYGVVGPFVAVDARPYVLEVRDASGAVLASQSLSAAAEGVYTVLLRGRNAPAAPADERLTVDLIKNLE